MPPDVRVRLTAEGVAEVVAALEAVRKKSEQTAGTGAKAFGGLNKALMGTRALLAQLGLILSVGAFVGIVKGSAEAADSLQKLGQSVGASTTNLQILAHVAKTSDIEISQLSKALGVFAKASTDAIETGGKMASALRAVGFSAQDIQDLAGKDSVERFAALAEKFAGIGDSAKKTTLAIEIFGQKLGPGLIPLLNKFGTEGIAGARKELEELGILMDEDLVAQLGDVDDRFKLLTAQSRGLANQFSGGLAPALRSTLGAITENLKGSGRVWRDFGESIGFVIRLLAAILIPTLDHLIAMVANLGDAVAGAVGFWRRALTGDLPGAYAEFVSHLKRIGARTADVVKGDIALWKNLFKTPAVEAVAAAAKADADLSEIYQKRREALRAQLDGEIALIRATLKAREDAYARAYEDGLLSLRTFYAERQRIAARAIQAEIAAIQKKALLDQQSEEDAEKRRAIAVKADAEIRKLNLDRRVQSAALDAEEARKTQELGDKAIAIEAKIQEAQGNRHAAEIARIHKELEEARKILIQNRSILPGETDDQIRTLERLERSERLLLALSEAQEAVASAQAELGRERARIEDRAAQGLISQAQAQAELLQLDRDRLAVLRERAGEALRLAQETQDPTKIDQAEEMVDSIEKIALAVSAANQDLQRIGSFAIDAFGDSLVRTLGEGEIASLSFGSVLKNVLLDLAQALRRFITQLLVTRMLMAIFRGGGAAGGTAAGGIPGGAGDVSGPVIGAGGGLVSGPGTGTSDSIPARLSTGEYIVKAAAVARPGILEALEFINRGTPAFRLPHAGAGPARFAEGGFVGPGGSGGPSQAWIRLGMQRGFFAEMIRSPEGKQAILEVVEENPRAFGSLLGTR